MSATWIIILSLLLILVIGFIVLISRYVKNSKRLYFAYEYRDKFVQLANSYSSSYDRFDRRGALDPDLYTWLMKNVNQIQFDLGSLGRVHYIAPFRIYEVSNYQVIINTIPKFRTGKLDDFDVNTADDCLLRYSGMLEKIIERNWKDIKNPIIWFREGFQQILSLPFYIFNWFGILSDTAVGKITTNPIFTIFSGIGGLVAFISGVVTIIQGKEQTMTFIKNLFGK